MKAKPGRNTGKSESAGDFEKYPAISDVVSSTECTGLTATPPQDEQELESYKELSSMQTPKRKNPENK